MIGNNGYIGRSPSDSTVIVSRQVFQPTGVQTSFTFSSGYEPGYFEVYLNGIKQIASIDYTATDTSTFSFIVPAEDGDIVEGVAYKAFNVATIDSSSGDFTVGGNLFVTGESKLNKVAITTTSTDLTLEAGKTYIYYSAGTYTLPASPTSGDRLEIINRSGIVTAVLARNGSNIMGVADDLDLDILDAAFKVTYSNDTDGWVVGT